MMKKLGIALVLILGVVIFWFPGKNFYHYFLTECPGNILERQGDFEMYLEDFDLDQYGKILENFSDTFEIKLLEEIIFEGKNFPIHQVDIKGKSTEKKLAIFAATHGDEFVSAMVIPALLESFRSGEIDFSEWHIRIITPVNPVGIFYQSRYEENGCDINRDFSDFRTAGARLQRDVLVNFEPDLVVSLHEGPQDGFFVIATSKISKNFVEILGENLLEKDIDLAVKSFFGLPLSEFGIMYEGWFFTGMKKILGIDSLGKYAGDLGIGVITTESSYKDKDLEKRMLPHLVVIESVLKNFKE